MRLCPTLVAAVAVLGLAGCVEQSAETDAFRVDDEWNEAMVQELTKEVGSSVGELS